MTSQERQGDPPNLVVMLCREQRTALTTRTCCEFRREKSHVEALRLQTPSSLFKKVVEGRFTSPSSCSCSSRTSLLYNSFYYCSHPLSLFGHSCSNSSIISDNLVDINNKLGNAVSLPSDVDRNCRTASSRRRRTDRLIIPKFSEVLVWLCLLCLMYPVCTKGAPVAQRIPNGQITSALKKMEENGVPLWINPCGMGSNDEAMPQGIEIPYVSDRELLNQIILQAKNALAEADSKKEDYVKKIFKVDYTSHQNSWKQNHYDWLPGKKDIPKNLGERISNEHLQAVQNNVDGTLVNTYEYLQKYAVGLEQVASDQRANIAPFRDLFTNAEYKLRAVLCEIQVAIIERGAERRADVKRDIMGDEFRTLDETYRNLRDWIILRDYMNALEYIIQVFEFFSSNMKS